MRVCVFFSSSCAGQKGKYGDLIMQEGSGLASLMETFTGSASDSDDGNEVRGVWCVFP